MIFYLNGTNRPNSSKLYVVNSPKAPDKDDIICPASFHPSKQFQWQCSHFNSCLCKTDISPFSYFVLCKYHDEAVNILNIVNLF